MPAAGKTTLADQLAVVLRAQGREVIRASIEGFLLPRSLRYRRGEDSAEGCYHDSFDFDALHRVLLDPLGPAGDRRFQQAVYDTGTDTALSQPVTTAPAVRHKPGGCSGVAAVRWAGVRESPLKT